MFKDKFIKILKIIGKVIICVFALIGVLFTGVFIAMKLHITNVKGSIDSRNQFFNNVRSESERMAISRNIENDWMNSPEFQIFKAGVLKDKDLIDEVSKETGVSARLIVSTIMPEQLRFFTSNRESFKKFFEPLKILGNYTQFSYGISGIKMETAQKVENNLKDKTSPFYLGTQYENILDYPNGSNVDEGRLSRFTDSHNHYYSYLYTALFLKEVMSQWMLAGYPISDRPEVLSTLFNLGFNKSEPKDNPEVGGSKITINGKDYTFGGLSYDFYYGTELTEFSPFDVQ